jgi:hypothetical protein
MGPRKTLRTPLRVVFYREGDSWIAHCLEFDLMGDGATQGDALESLSVAIVLQVDASLEFNNLANLFSPADGKYFEMFAEGSDVSDRVSEIRRIIERLKLNSPIEVDIGEVESREYEDCDAEDPECALA